nr:MAG TPA: hypothetical protein [Caudoviricetes sp.]
MNFCRLSAVYTKSPQITGIFQLILFYSIRQSSQRDTLYGLTTHVTVCYPCFNSTRYSVIIEKGAIYYE